MHIMFDSSSTPLPSSQLTQQQFATPKAPSIICCLYCLWSGFKSLPWLTSDLNIQNNGWLNKGAYPRIWDCWGDDIDFKTGFHG
jgi:hypothetical protein